MKSCKTCGAELTRRRQTIYCSRACFFRDTNNGFAKQKNVKGGLSPMAGKKHTPESKAKIRAKRALQIAIPPSDEARAKGRLHRHLFGTYRQSESTKLKISLTTKGRKRGPMDESVKRKISISKTGKPGWSRGRRFPTRSGSNHFRWKGGITPLNSKIRHSVEYNNWRRAVFVRDGFSCVIGGKAHGNKLHADHIKSFSDFPDLRFDVSNGRTLCVDCHRKTPNYGGRK